MRYFLKFCKMLLFYINNIFGLGVMVYLLCCASYYCVRFICCVVRGRIAHVRVARVPEKLDEVLGNGCWCLGLKWRQINRFRIYNCREGKKGGIY